MFEICIILVALGSAFMVGRLVEEDNRRKWDDNEDIEDLDDTN